MTDKNTNDNNNNFYFPSVPLPTKDLRLLLRRVNKCIRDLNESLNDVTSIVESKEQEMSCFGGVDSEHLSKLADLIQVKAIQKINSSRVYKSFDQPEVVLPLSNDISEDPCEIIQELI